MRHLLPCLFGSFLFVATLLPRSSVAEPDYPRLANYYLHGYVDPAHIASLAKWDLVILNTVWTEQQLQALRALNPDIKIYLYLCAYAVETPPNPNNAWNVMAYNNAQDYDLWWYDADGRIASDWPGSQMVNVLSSTSRGPVGGEWLRFVELLVEQIVAQHPSIDGIFLDNFWTRISWNQDRLRLDSDCRPSVHPQGCDGIPDDKATLDARWNTAMDDLARHLRASFDRMQVARPRPLTLLSNSSSDYFESLNGSMYEFFPGGSSPDYGSLHNYAWREAMFQWPGGYDVAPFRTQPYGVSVINASWQGTTLQPARTEGFERHKRFTLGSALLGNGYYSFDAGPAGHGNLWWEPEYDDNGRGKGYLGQPSGAAYSLPSASGPERVDNGDFQRGLDAWTTSFAGAVGEARVVEHATGALAQISLGGLRNPGGAARLSQSGVQLQRDQSYSIRLTAQAVTRTDLEVTLTSSACPDGRCMKTWHFGLGTVARQHAVSFVSPADAAATLSLTVKQPTQVRVQEVSLRSGSIDLYRRDFQRGTVLVNYTNDIRMVAFSEPLTRLLIPGSGSFDGRTVSVDFIAPGDAVIYLRPQGDMGKAARPVATALRMTTQSDHSQTTFRIEVAQPQAIRLRIFDVRGRLVRQLTPELPLSAGTHELHWQYRDQQRTPVARGIYFVQLESAQPTLSRKIVVTR